MPHFSTEIHYETEVAFRFGKSLEILEVAVANDLTARDLQKAAQTAGQPWSVAKAFKNSCGIGNWALAKDVDLLHLEFQGRLNGKAVQEGNTEKMIFRFEDIQKYLIDIFPVKPGDIVLTGTPQGVGPVRPGDLLEMEIFGLSQGRWEFT